MHYRLMLAFVVVAVLFGSGPLHAQCSASVSASVSNDIVIVTGNGGGDCATSSVEIFVDGTSIGSSFCNDTSQCQVTRQYSISCLTDGPHVAEVRVDCSRNTGAGGSCTPVAQGHNTTTFNVNTKPTVSLAIVGPDSTGHGTFNVSYSFPATTFSEFRALRLYKDDALWTQTKAPLQDGVWSVPFDTTCWKTGTYTFRADADSCREHASSGNQQLSVNTKPTISLSIAGPDSSGHGTLNVSYSFPNTDSPEQRTLILLKDGAPLANTSGAQQEGTWSVPLNVACWSTGTYRFTAEAFACSSQEPEYSAQDEKSVSVDSTPSVSVSASAPDPSGMVTVTATYSFPDTDNPAQRSVQLYQNETLFASFAPAQQSGTSQPYVVVSCGTIKAVANACLGGEGHTAEQEINLPPDGCREDRNSCPIGSGPPSPPLAAAGRPVNYGSGDMGINLAPPAFRDEPLPLTFDLQFHSSRPVYVKLASEMAPGWSHTYSESIRPVDPAAQLLYRIAPGGREQWFQRIGTSAVWLALRPRELRDQVTLVGTEYRVIDLNGTTKAFDAATGRWLRTTDRWGNTLTGALNAAGQLASVSDRAGHQLLFTWTAGQLTAVTLSDGSSWRFEYEDGNLSGIYDPLHTGTTPWRKVAYANNRVHEPRLLTEMRDDADALLEGHTYDSQDRAITSFVEGNREMVTFAYDTPASGATRVTHTIDASHTQVTDFTLIYQPGRYLPVHIVGNCATCGNSVDEETREYDASNHVTSSIDATGVTTLYNYNADGNPLYRKEAAGTSLERVTTWEYGMPGWPNFVTKTTEPAAPGGLATVERSWNTGESVLTEKRTGNLDTTAGSTVTYTSTITFDSAHRSVAFDGPRTDVYDLTLRAWYADSDSNVNNRGRLARITDASGLTTLFADYDPFGTPRSVTDPNGVVTLFQTDSRGRVTRTTSKAVTGDATESVDYVSQTTYDSRDRVTDTIPPRGNRIHYEYEAGTNLLTSTVRIDLSGNEVERRHVTYNVLGDRILEEYQSCATPAASCGSWSTQRSDSFLYDNHNRLSQLTHQDGTRILYAYDPNGQLQSVTDENHTSPNTTYLFDALRRLKRVTATLAGGTAITQYDYDVQDDLISVTDPNGNQTTYAYDAFRRLRGQTSPVTGVTTYAYDEAGNLKTTVDADGRTTSRTWDASNRALSASSTAGGPAEVTVWSWDASPAVNGFGAGRIASMTDPTGSTVFRYDRRGLLTRETKNVEGSAWVTTYGYDSNGNRTSIGYPSGRTVGYTFDFADRPYSASTGSTTLVSSATYRPFGSRLQTVFGNGTTIAADYDSRYAMSENKLTGPAGVLARYTYSHDAAGNITAIHDALDASWDRTFLYDDLNRLVTANSGSSLWGNGSYTYDAMGNILNFQLGIERSAAFTYSGTTPLLTSATENGLTRSVAYDNAGNEKDVATSHYDYSARNLLRSDGKWTYGWDGRGVRTVASFGCPGVVTPSPLHVGKGGAAGTLAISAAADCAWSAVADASWITLGSPATGSGSGSVSFTVAPNSGSASRTATISFGTDRSVLVTQAGSTMATTMADLTGDGTADLLWRHDVSGDVRAFTLERYNVTGTLALGTHADRLTRLVGLGDFDGDGRTDLLWRNSRSGALSIDFVGAAGTVTQTSLTPEASTFIKVAATGDFDGDGRADLAWRDSQSGAVSLRLLNGATTVGGGTIVASSVRELNVVAAGDLNGDGRCDLVWQNSRTGEVIGRLLNGTTVLSSATITTEPDTQWKIVATGDFDGDGKADLVWRHRRTGAVNLQLMDGLVGGTRVAIATDADTRWTIAGTGDTDGDGRSDLIWRNSYTGAVRVDSISGTLVTASGLAYTEPDRSWKLVTPASAPSSQRPARADFACDVTSDIMWRNTETNDIAMWEMNGSTILNGSTIVRLGDGNQSLQTAGDFNGDGTSDLLWRNRNTNAVAIWDMNGHAMLNPHAIAQLTDGNWQFQGAADVTGDGVDDLILRNTQTQSIALWEMKGGLLQQGTILATLSDANWRIQGLGDFSGDGRSDILWRNPVTGSVAIWQVEGSVLASATTFATADPSYTIVGTGDYNNDGRSDILWRSVNGALSIWEMNGTTVVRNVDVATLADPNWKVQATGGDFDGDATADILFRHNVSSNVAMWQMNDSRIRTSASIASEGSVWQLQALERNGDSGSTINVLSTPSPSRTALTAGGTPPAHGGGKWWSPAPGGPPFWGPPIVPPVPQWVTGVSHAPFWEPALTPPGTVWWTPLAGSGPATLPASGASLTMRQESTTATLTSMDTPPAPNRRHSLYTPELNLLAEAETATSAAPAVAWEYVWFNGQPAAQIETATGAIHYYFNDHLGTPILTTDSTGTIDWRVEREPYGARIRTRTGSARYQPLAFPGQEEDENSDRSYNIYRWYRAGWGRYTQGDPLGLASDVNVFAYAHDAPSYFVDPSGLAHTPGGPYHPPDDSTIKCYDGDPCELLKAKIIQFALTIASHQIWAAAHPGDPHATEIVDLAKGLANCMYIFLKRQDCHCMKPRDTSKDPQMKDIEGLKNPSTFFGVPGFPVFALP